MSNPLIKLELLRRFRSPAAAWGIPLVVALPGIAVVLIYASTLNWSTSGALYADSLGDPGGVRVDDLRGVGTGMFIAVVAALVVTLLVLVPAMVGGSIAGERHSQTLQPLQLTAMTPTQILVGKLVSSLAYLLLALLCAAPVVVIPFLLGGLSATQVLGAYVVLLMVTVELAAVALMVSAVMSRPGPAIVVALLACGALTVFPWILTGVGFLVVGTNDLTFDAGSSPVRYLASLSPVSLGSWVLDLRGSQELASDAVRTEDKVLSLLWFLIVTTGSLLVARRHVTTPVDQDG